MVRLKSFWRPGESAWKYSPAQRTGSSPIWSNGAVTAACSLEQASLFAQGDGDLDGCGMSKRKNEERF